MPKKRASSPPPPPVQRFDEANVARLGLISIQERIPEGHNTWAVHFSVDGRPARLSCDALPRHGGVPHGLDNDVSLALVTLFVEAGSPDNGIFDTSAYQILRVAGLDTSGYYYKALKTSLDRLSTATYTASEAWRSGGRWTTVRFRYIDRLEYTSDDAKLNLSGASAIRITLAREIVQSVKAQYIKPVNLALLGSLERPLTRALFRLLDAQRRPVDDPSGAAAEYTVNIVQWADACKIVDKKPAKIRRTLDGAHRELIDKGYLKTVEYEGRGEKQLIRYEFARDALLPPQDAEVVAALVRHGVAPGVGRKLVQQYGPAHVTARIRRFEAIIASGYQPRSRGAMLVDVIRDAEEKYADPAGYAQRTKEPQAPPARTPRRQRDAAASSPGTDEQSADWRALPLEEQADRAMVTLKGVFHQRLTVPTQGALRAAILAGRVDARDLVERALRSAMNMQLEELAHELTVFLQDTDPRGS